MSAAGSWRGDDARAEAPPSCSGREPSSGEGGSPPVGAMYRSLRAAPRAAGDYSRDRQSEPRPAPPRARPLRSGRGSRDRPPPPSSGFRPPLRAGSAGARVHIILGTRRLTVSDLCSQWALP